MASLFSKLQIFLVIFLAYLFNLVAYLILQGKNLENFKIPFTCIQSATDNFSKSYEIKRKAECRFYRAQLDHYDKENHSSMRRSTVVIKRYPFESKDCGEKEFLTEIKMLSTAKHPNVVTLLGICVEASEMILVIENFSNGFLRECLKNVNNKRILTWEKRLKICIEVTQALKYIHFEMEDQKMIINRDICSKNIGLDENWGAKLLNFEDSVFLPPNQEDEALYIKYIGIHSYTDPEYERTDKLKRESDVYSFGVLLFEIICGRLADDPIYEKESEEGLAHVARRHFCKGTLEDMIDSIIKEDTSENNFVLHRGPNSESLHTFIEIAYQCVAETQDQRPTMKVVVKELEKALFLQKNNKHNPKISLLEIIHATQNFHKENCIGGGGFGN